VNLPGTQDLRFFNPYAEVHQTENRLPHWQQKGAVYFVTFRLGDAVPSRLLVQWEGQRDAWLRAHPTPWTSAVECEYHLRFSGAIERWLDAGYGACLLKRGDCAKIVAGALQYFEGDRIAMISFVVMPNHVHALFVQNPEWTLERLIKGWKRFTSREINRHLEQSGSLWQRDYFDRLVRDEKHFANCVRYIRRNPERARLKEDQYILYESEIARGIY
jgi:REP-associated tyrosine transposase